MHLKSSGHVSGSTRDHQLLHDLRASCIGSKGTADRWLDSLSSVAGSRLKRQLLMSPEAALAYHEIGAALIRSGDLGNAIWFFDRCARIGTHDIRLMADMGNIFQSVGDLQKAEKIYLQGILLAPEIPLFYFNRVLTMDEKMSSQWIFSHLERTLQISPDMHQAQYHQGRAFFRQGRFHEAEASFRACLVSHPNNIPARLELGNLLLREARLNEAGFLYRQAIMLSPADPRGYANLGNTLSKGIPDPRSIILHRRSIRINPDDPMGWINLGNAFKSMGQTQVAATSYRMALQQMVDCAEAYMNLGVVLYELGCIDPAENAFAHAIRIKPDFAEAYWNRSLAHLLRGRFESGWALYEWRFQHSSLAINKRPGSLVEWDLITPLEGKSLLLYAEQGFGDCLQFVRFAFYLKRMGVHVTLEVQPALKALLSNLKMVNVIGYGEPAPDQDLQFPLMSLPWALGIDEPQLPLITDYIHADPAHIQSWKAQISHGSRIRVGLVVSGNPSHSQDHARSIPLSALAPLFLSGLDFYLLQKEIRDEDLAVASTVSNLHLLHDKIKDFTDTAALIHNLDLIISVDTSVAHLAGAMGVQTWILLPFLPDWRWQLERKDSPWYPSFRLYRQGAANDWTQTIQQVSIDLQNMDTDCGS